MNVSFDSKYWLYFSRRAGQVMLRQKSTQPTAGTPKKATRKPCLRQAGMYIAFSGPPRRTIELCATVVINSGSLIGLQMAKFFFVAQHVLF